MKRKSTEAYSGQRGKEKRELFGRFRLRVIEDVCRNTFFALFNHRCFKCGVKERPYKEIGRPPVLCIDHHVPMAWGGHLVPGNLVALCRNCNNKKLDSPPEGFYTPSELEELKPILEQQDEIFSFTFDWDAWHKDREGYLVNLGVAHSLVQELLFNSDHPDYVDIASDDVGVAITINLEVSYVDKDR